MGHVTQLAQEMYAEDPTLASALADATDAYLAAADTLGASGPTWFERRRLEEFRTEVAGLVKREVEGASV